MRSLRGAVLMIGLAVLAFAGFGAWIARYLPMPENAEALLRRLPTQDAVVAGFDFKALRAARLLEYLTASKAVEDPEYLAFVRDTGFDYTRDLDQVMVSFSPDGEFFLVKGRFDWKKLEAYAAAQKGECGGRFCRMAGSTAEKKISFFPLRGDVLAMAVAPDERAANRLRHSGPRGDVDVPKQPVWVTFSAGALRHSTSLPGSSKLFASAITDAERVTITAGQSGGNIEARLDAICRDAQQAGALTEQLQAVTSMLRTAAQREGQPISPGDLGGLLTAGTFQQAGSHVMGRWPVSRELIANLTSGI